MAAYLVSFQYPPPFKSTDETDETSPVRPQEGQVTTRCPCQHITAPHEQNMNCLLLQYGQPGYSESSSTLPCTRWESYPSRLALSLSILKAHTNLYAFFRRLSTVMP